MRTAILLSLLLLTSVLCQAQLPSEALSPADHLLAINAQWEGKANTAEGLLSFHNDTERIAFHLSQVIKRLEAVEVKEADIKAKRTALIRTLKVYQEEGKFPINTRHSKRTPYFIDDFGTACAVGHLMIESGRDDLALRIKEEHNFDYIADIKTVGVLDWATEYGFSLDELALIQPAYAPTNQLSTVGLGVNGPITCMTAVLDDRLYLYGDFDLMDGSVVCETGFGYYQDDTYHCIDNGPSGIIHNMVRSTNYDLLVVGALMHEGLSYPAAVYSDAAWEYLSLPERPNAVGKTIVYHYSTDNRYVLSIDPLDGTGNNEVWRYVDGTIGFWEHLITTNGPINCSSEQYNDIIGGDFETYIDHHSDDIEVACSGLVAFDFYSSSSPVIPYFSEFLPDAITSLHSVGEILYVGGTCDDIYPNTYLTRLQNSVFQALIYHTEDWGQQDVGLYDIDTYSDNQLLLAGDMDMGDFGTIGNNLGTYNLLGGYLSPLAMLDLPVHSVASFNGDLYAGGEFTNNIGYPLNHIAKIGVPTGLLEEEQIAMTLSPNPASSYLDIRFEEPIATIESLQILSIDGKEQSVSSTFSDQGIHMDVSTLANGVYLYALQFENGRVSGRFVKE